jgi:hypothetical protein
MRQCFGAEFEVYEMSDFSIFLGEAALSALHMFNMLLHY